MNMDDRTIPKTRNSPGSVRGPDFRSVFVGPGHGLNFEDFQNRRFEIQSRFFYLFENPDQLSDQGSRRSNIFDLVQP